MLRRRSPLARPWTSRHDLVELVLLELPRAPGSRAPGSGSRAPAVLGIQTPTARGPASAGGARPSASTLLILLLLLFGGAAALSVLLLLSARAAALPVLMLLLYPAPCVDGRALPWRPAAPLPCLIQV